jgi:DNA repair protein RecO (recombination protein O)
VPIVTTRSVVLQTYPYSDTSKILRLLTLDHGPQSVMARGALRPRSRLSGVLEPFADGTATFYFKPDRDLHTLSDFELARERQALGRDLQRYAAASVLCELVLRLAPAERDLPLYRALVGGLDALLEATPGTVPGTALAACWSLVDVLGFAPDLSGCASCGDDLSAREGRLDVREGTLVCERCLPGGGVLPPSELDDLRRLAAGDPVGPSPSARQVRLLVEFIRHHAAEGIHLRSLDFLLAEEVR